MKTPAVKRPPRKARPAPRHEIAALRTRLTEAEEALRAIQGGEVDAVVVAGKNGTQVFTLEGAEHAYRALIESMNEGALTLTADKTILYANQCFAKMVKCPLEQVMGGSLRRFLSDEDGNAIRPFLKRPGKTGTKMQVPLHASDGSQLPVQISLRPLERDGASLATIGMVVTDLSEPRRTEELLRALTHRAVQAQETERGRIAHELHDTITQSLCAVLIRSQVLANSLAKPGGPAKKEAAKLCEMLGEAVEEVEHISRNLRPSVLEHLGLVAGLRATSVTFTDRTGIPVELACVELTPRLPADTELALYRILQETLKNVEKHARARHVTMHLTKADNIVLMVIKDDGVGFDPDHHPARAKGKGGLGLMGMRERAMSVGGVLKVKSARRTGTEVELRIQLAAIVAPIAAPPAASDKATGKAAGKRSR